MTKTWRTKPRRPGAGRKSRYGNRPMVKLNARIPQRVKTLLIAEYGSVQAAVDALVIEPMMTRVASEEPQ